ncbi:MAG: MFS transporter [Oscillospiraceae bacterium]|nr:MFS transporter [Oscillospiraceae bacterium]
MGSLTDRKKPQIQLYYLVTAIFWFSNYAYIPTMSPYLKSIGISYAAIGVIGGAYGLAQILLRVPAGILSDRIGRRKIFIIAGALFGMLSSLGLYFTTNAMWIGLMRFLSGVSASTWVVYTILFASYFAGDSTASKLSYLNMANTAGIMAAKLLGSFAVERWGYRSAFLLSAAVGLAGVLLSIFITENIPETAARPSVLELLSVIRDKNLLTISVLAGISQMLVFATTNTFTPELAAVLGADSVQLGVLSTLSTVAMMFTAMICGRLFRKRINLRMFMAASFLMQAAGTVMTAYAPNVTAVYIASAVAGLGFGFCYVCAIGHCTLTVDPEKRSVAMGFFQAIYSVGMFAGPIVIGLAAQLAGLSRAIALSALLAAAGMVLALVVIRK